MSAENDNDPLPEEFGQGDGTGQDDVMREIAALRTEADNQKDRALRALAEVENVRKRLERERDEARTYSVTRFARDFLTVADNLSRALAAVPADARAKADDSLKAVLDGIEATERELQAALARHGVKPIAAEGQRFDPHLHQAIAEVPAKGAEPGSVVNVVQPGYTIGERLLRPAMVTVAKADGSRLSGNGVDSSPAGSKIDTKV
ncbi:MAG TPA: nucleotide exchange factor GrpE [Micropepsaceae bacterium]|nr:nucleotide exchange factor GrpE [Micropepsaceae bacterium]